MLDLGLCVQDGELVPSLTLESPIFSADGKTLSMTVTLPNDVYSINGNNLLHTKGTYQITVDLETGVATAKKAI